MDLKVKDVMFQDLPVLYEEDTILSASKFMKKEKIRNLPVVGKDKKLVGLITLRELVETVFKNPDHILIKDSMIKIVETVAPDESLSRAIEVMLLNKYGCLPVVDENKKLIGMLTEADLLKTLYDVSNLPSELLKIKSK